MRVVIFTEFAVSVDVGRGLYASGYTLAVSHAALAVSGRTVVARVEMVAAAANVLGSAHGWSAELTLQFFFKRSCE